MPDSLFLIGTLSWGIIGALILVASTIILTIPVFATRGMTQLVWFLVVGGILTLELAGLVTVGILIETGNL
ncbi:MAG TPA: hypothetical protein VFK32_07280 [Tepidiformaceae bacterium]|nr:hypothetical protein [Tepidiformaceae bacterium]